MTGNDIQDPNDDTIIATVLEDVFRVLRADAALLGVSVEEHIVGMIHDAAVRIAEEAETT